MNSPIISGISAFVTWHAHNLAFTNLNAPLSNFIATHLGCSIASDTTLTVFSKWYYGAITNAEVANWGSTVGFLAPAIVTYFAPAITWGISIAAGAATYYTLHFIAMGIFKLISYSKGEKPEITPELIESTAAARHAEILAAIEAQKQPLTSTLSTPTLLQIKDIIKNAIAETIEEKVNQRVKLALASLSRGSPRLLLNGVANVNYDAPVSLEGQIAAARRAENGYVLLDNKPTSRIVRPRVPRENMNTQPEQSLAPQNNPPSLKVKYDSSSSEDDGFFSFIFRNFSISQGRVQKMPQWRRFLQFKSSPPEIGCC